MIDVEEAKIIAVDFDGCLVEDRYPNIGEPNVLLMDDLKRRKQSGTKIILWTCRQGERLKAAVSFCEDRGLTFDAVNENLPENIEKYGKETRKVYADLYIDDKALNIEAEVCTGGE